MKLIAKFALFPLFFLTGIALCIADDFTAAKPGRVFHFPQDHGAHPDFKTEWWYYTGHLKSKDGETFGYQLTFFRVALTKPNPKARSAWAAHTIYFAHLALTDPNRKTFFFTEKAQRGAMGLAGAKVGELKVWVDDWQAEARGEAHHLKAKAARFSLDFVLTPLKPPVLQGEAGYSRKSATAKVASHYYSITRLATKGQLVLDGRVIPVEGSSWLDREFSSGQMGENQVGWDWFALQLSDGADLMLYLMRLKDGSIDPASSGTLIDPQGQARHLKLAEFTIKAKGTWTSPHSHATYPATWEITLPQSGYRLTLTPALSDQELRTGTSPGIIYWEGQVSIKGQKKEKPLTGQGYVELTGYAGSLGGRF